MPDGSTGRRSSAPFGSWLQQESLRLVPDSRTGPRGGYGPRSGSRSNGATSTGLPGLVRVRRVFTDGQSEAVRQADALAPPRAAARAAARALDELPPRIDTHSSSPAARGGHLNLHDWRATSGRRPYAPPASSTGRPTRCATVRDLRDRRRRSAVRARPLHGHVRRQIDRTMGTCCPTRSTARVLALDASSAALRPRPADQRHDRSSTRAADRPHGHRSDGRRSGRCASPFGCGWRTIGRLGSTARARKSGVADGRLT